MCDGTAISSAAYFQQVRLRSAAACFGVSLELERVVTTAVVYIPYTVQYSIRLLCVRYYCISSLLYLHDATTLVQLYGNYAPRSISWVRY